MDYKGKNKKWKNRHFLSSFNYALCGLKTVLKEERNFRFDVGAALVTIVLGIGLKISFDEWLWILLSIFLVLILEVVNSAIENVVDLATDYARHPLAKKAKDMAAGAVLLGAFFALIVACLIFISKILVLV